MNREFFRDSVERFVSCAGILFTLILFTWSCGSSRQSANFEGEGVQIDDLISEQDAGAKRAEDAEVLRLLGITPAETQPGKAEVTEAMQTETTETTPSIGQLRQELDEKERAISVLRTELTQKEMQISELEDQVASRKQLARPATDPQQKTDFRSRYQDGLNEFNSRNYEGALAIFSELLLSDAKNSLSDNCQYWIGECYYALTNYNQAISEFEKVFSFPNSNKNDDSQLKLGLCYLRLGDDQQARSEFDRLLANYPDSEYTEIARKHLTQL